MVDSSFDYQAALAGCAKSQPLALRQLFTQEAPCMLALANIMLNDQTAAQAAVHDTFVLIWKNAQSYDSGMGDARAWIHSIMRYRTLSLLRKQPVPASSASSTAALPFRAADINGLAGALSRQPEHLRKPVLMAFYNGMGYADIARQLGRPVAELRDNLRACLSTLREQESA